MSQDLRYAFRAMRRHRGLSAVVILTLALAIGANTAIFSLMDGLLFASLPVRDPQNLLMLHWSARHDLSGIQSMWSFGDCGGAWRKTSNTGSCSFSLPVFHALQQETHTLTELTATAGNQQYDLVAGGQASTMHARLVAGNYFEVMGLQPFAGRLLHAADGRTGAPPVVVLSYAYWQQRFGGSRGAIGSTVELNRHPVMVAGVTRPGFGGITPGMSTDAWLQLGARQALDPHWTPDQDAASSVWLVLFGRPRPGVSHAAVQTELSGLFRNQVIAGPNKVGKASDDPQVEVLPAQSAIAGARQRFRQPLWVLLWLVGAILLIACANIAGLLVGRAQARSREFAVRRALGAGSGSILRQLLTESLLLAVCGGILGIGLAYLAAHALAATIAGGFSFVTLAVHAPLDGRVLLFALGATILTGVLAGLAPALHGLRGDLHSGLKDSLGNSASVSGRRQLRWLHLGNGLVVAQAALCVVVLAGAGLLVRTLANLRSIDPGFDTQNLLLFNLDPSSQGYSGARLQQLLDRVQRNLAALPGVENVSYSSSALLTGSLWVSGYRLQPGGKEQDADALQVGTGFFKTLGMHVLAGRDFRSTDYVAPPPPGAKPDPNRPPQAALVNEAFVRKYLGRENPLGRVFGYDKHGTHPRYTIIGVVSDAKYQDLREAIDPTVYMESSRGSASFEVRTAGAPLALLPVVRRLLHGVDPNLPIIRPTTQTASIATLLFRERLLAHLASLFAALALLLAAIGIYALLAQEVTRRTREIGIRMALGAERRRVVRMVILRGARLALAGIVVGVAGATAVTRYLHSMLYGVSATDPVTLAAVAAILFAVALLACWLPARRAAHVDPMVALRYE